MNEETSEWLELERRKQNGTLEKWRLAFLTDGFYIKISGGEETKSDPPSYLDHIKDYNTVIVELYKRGEYPSKEELAEFNKPITVAGYTININTIVFPHRALFPPHEKYIQDQFWAEKFKWESEEYSPSASLTLNDLDKMMKYLVKLDGLAAFL